MPRLTVMMAAFRAQETIGPAVRSTLRALPKDSELVVAIDGPDLATEAVLERIGDPRLRVLTDEVNVGTSLRHQQILMSSDSEYVANLDADDITLPWRFAVTLPLLGAADLAFGSAIRFGRGMAPRPSFPAHLGPEETAVALPFYVPLYHSSLVARRDALVDVGGYRKIGYAEDWELWIRSAARGKRLEKVALPVIGYRLSPTQMSQNSERFVGEFDNAFWSESHDALLERYGIPGGRYDGERTHLSQAEFDSLLGHVTPRNRRYLESHMAGGAVISEGRA